MREMILTTEVEETIKWGAPVYTINGKNVVSIAAFKNHCAMWFYNGAWLTENRALLEIAQEGKTKALRQIRFDRGKDIPVQEVRKYVLEAIQNQKEGKEIKPIRTKKVEIPAEMATALSEDPALEVTFQNLSTGNSGSIASILSRPKERPHVRAAWRKSFPC